MGCVSSAPEEQKHDAGVRAESVQVQVNAGGKAAPVAQMQGLRFMKQVKKVNTERDYSILVDMSGSMKGSRWKQALEALTALAPSVADCDPDGVALYFFNNKFEKIENVASADQVMSIFGKRSPGGGTTLAPPLADAVKPDAVGASGKRRPETILVISDGEPSDRAEVEQVIINATKNHMQADEDLSITIIQVGDDQSAQAWLSSLDNDLQGKGAKFDIVDIMTMDDFKGMSFQEVIRRSLQD